MVDILIVDLGMTFSSRQEQIVALIQTLRSKGISYHIVCFEKSELASRLDKNKAFLLKGHSPHNPFTLLKIKKIIESNSFTIIHLFGGNAVCAAKYFLRWSYYNGILIVSEDAFPYDEKECNIPLNCYRGVKPFYTTRILCPSLASVKRLVAAGALRALLKSIPIGLNEETSLNHIERKDGRFVFLASAPLYSEHGLKCLIEAVSLLKARTGVPPWEVRIIGVLNDFPMLLDYAKNIGADDCISFLGKQSVDTQLSISDMAVITNPAPQDKNLFILQSIRAGVPLICSNVSTTTELIHDEGNALLFTPDNAEELAECMYQSMTNRNLYVQLLQGGDFPRHTLRLTCNIIAGLYVDLAAERME